MKSSKRNVNSSVAAPAKPLKSPEGAEWREIRTEDLLEPIDPARQSFDEEKLQELIGSIRELGIIEPLIVQGEGNKFRVHAGHRRLIAARALALPTVPCRVYRPGDLAGEAIKHHENRIREDLNPAEEARYLMRLYQTKCGEDVDKVCDLVKANRHYVEQRLLLCLGDERVFEALLAGLIAMGVADELNKVKDGARRMMYLDAAIQGGASVRMVKDWRVRGNALDEQFANLNGPVPEEPDGAVHKATITEPTCYICGIRDLGYDLEILYMHRACARAVQRLGGKFWPVSHEQPQPDEG